ncbi:MAG: phage repressor protein [Alphaproteobacteria bacterium]|nr:MAG: phage repressor protein [Alphaproteobacteria bacterium]
MVFYDDVRTPVTPDLIGHLCVVGLPDGRVLVKRLQKAAGTGFFHLISNTEGPILDQPVDWAAKVKTMTPR